MSDLAIEIFSKLVFGGSICLILYIVYREWKYAKIKAEQAEMELGEKENEDLVSAMSDQQLIDTVNSEVAKLPIPPSRPPTKK
jgi:hypothetical protein